MPDKAEVQRMADTLRLSADLLVKLHEEQDEARQNALVSVYQRVNAIMEPNPAGPSEKGWNDACVAVREAIVSLRNPS